MKMEDIAKLAGVSKSAVSLALNGKSGISPETRERILQIANDNNYLPKSRTSSNEKTTKSLTFLVLANSGIVLEDYYQQPFFRELIHHIEERCRVNGYSLLFSSVQIGAFEQGIDIIAEEGRSDGIILLGTNLFKEQIANIAAKLTAPLVVLDTSFDTLPVHFIEINNVMGAYQAGVHLCELGHTDIGYIASNLRIHNFNDRKQGFISALAEKGIEIADNRIFSVAPTILSSQEALASQFRDYLGAGNKLPSALFCECDYIAISAIKTLNELGYRVPEDVSVVGFDNISESVIVSPELTTIHVEKERMAHLAVDLVIESIASPAHASNKIKVDTQLIKRMSAVSPHSNLKR